MWLRSCLVFGFQKHTSSTNVSDPKQPIQMFDHILKELCTLFIESRDLVEQISTLQRDAPFLYVTILETMIIL